MVHCGLFGLHQAAPTASSRRIASLLAAPVFRLDDASGKRGMRPSMSLATHRKCGAASSARMIARTTGAVSALCQAATFRLSRSRQFRSSSSTVASQFGDTCPDKLGGSKKVGGCNAKTLDAGVAS